MPLCLESTQLLSGASVTSTPVRPVNIPRKEKEFQGMLQFKDGDTSRLFKNLIIGLCRSDLVCSNSKQKPNSSPLNVVSTDLKPRGVAVSFTPGLPAYIIFMCLRHADSVNDDRRVSTLLNSTISTIKGVIKVTN